MTHSITIGNIRIVLIRKRIKNVHLSVHPPDGHVSMAAPLDTRLDVARAYAATKIGWIRDQRKKLREQARETSRQFVNRESHYLWGRRYLLTVRERETKPSVTIDHRRIALTVRPGSDRDKRAEVMHAWHKSLLHAHIPRLIAKWAPLLGVSVNAYFLQRMKTKWGGCNQKKRHIRLNTELIKKPKDLLEPIENRPIFVRFGITLKTILFVVFVSFVVNN